MSIRYNPNRIGKNMKKLFIFCTLLWASRSFSAQLYIGFESGEYDTQACSNDWRHSGNELINFFFERGYEVYPQGSCISFSQNPEDYMYASYVIFRGSDAEIEEILEAAQGLKFQGEFISYNYLVYRMENKN